MSARHGSTQTSMSSEEVWNWAVSLHGGSIAEGMAARSLTRTDALLHIFPDGYRLWCSGGDGTRANTASRRYCPRCLALAREAQTALLVGEPEVSAVPEGDAE